MKTKGILIGIALSAICAMGYSQTRTPQVTKKQVNQQARIRNGVKTGKLTKVETIKLERQQRNIQRTKKAAKADGVVTPRERAHIHREQKRASTNIAIKKHNAAKR